MSPSETFWRRLWKKFGWASRYDIIFSRIELSLQLKELETKIMAKVSSLADTLGALADQLTTAQTDIQAEITALQASLSNMDEDIPADAQASLDRLTALTASLSQINPPAAQNPSTPAAPSA